MFLGGESDFLKAARQTAYLLVNKILFYNVLQAKRPQKLSRLNIPKDLEQGGILRDVLQAYFDYVLKHIDYQTIYKADFIDQTAFPEHTGVVEEITELVRVLRRYDFSELRFDVVGRIFERIIPQERRHQLGQYFTHPDVVDLILCFCLRCEEDKVFDPSCGAGTFLVRAYHHKKLMNQRLGHTEILKTLWGCDIGKFPAHLSTINLAINDLSVDANFPQILHQDFFALRLGGREEFSAEARNNDLMRLGEKRIVIPYPKIVDCIVGNPPYTRQEEIAEIAGDEGYKRGLIQSALYDGEKQIAEISKRAGIHAYFFVHGTKFLQDGGRFGFIVSNSWLDADYGKGLQAFFLRYYKIVAIIESKVERWFEAADINTCIVILERCTDERERDEHSVRFVYLLKPLRHFIPPAQDMWEEQLDRLNEIGKLMKTILAHSEFYQNEELRIFPKRQADLWEEGFDEEQGKYVGAKWGRYIRAPQIFFRILEKAKDKFVPLGEIAEVRRGFTTGANEFFYLTEEEIKRRKIEKEFWMHRDEEGNWVPNYVIKSPKECKSIVVKPEDLKYRVLMIHKDREELKGTNVLRYIRVGERRGFHERPTCASRGKRWYDLGKRTPFGFLHPMVHNDRQVIAMNTSGCFVDHNLFEIQPKNRKVASALAAYFTSTFAFLVKELGGRVNLGEGALKTEGIDIERFLTIHPERLDKSIVQKLENWVLRASSTFDHASYIHEFGASSSEEVSLDKVKPDRRELDRIVMGEILGLSDEEQLEVYRAVVDLVKSRIEKAKSFGKRRKTKEGIDVDLLVKTLKESIGEETLGRFYRERILSQEALYTRSLPKAKGTIRMDRDLYGWRLYYSGKRYIECASESEARYLQVWLEVGLEEVKVPEDEGCLDSLVPDLEELKKKTVATINEYLNASIPIRLRNRIQHQLWGEIVR